MDNFPCSLNGVYMDVMDELERGESECIRLNKTSGNFFMRKLRRNRSDTSVNSSEQSYTSISPELEPEHDECFIWELNMNNPYDDTKLEENYKKFTFTHLESSDLKEADTFDYIYLDKNRSTIKNKRQVLYHSMCSVNKSIHKNNQLNEFSTTSIINSHSNLNLNTTSNTTDLNKLSNLNNSKHDTILNIL